MAKAPSKKSAPKAKKARAKSAPTTTPAAAPATPAEAKSKNTMLLPMMLGAILIGVVLGMTFNSGSSSMSDREFEAKVEAYIEANAGAVIDMLNNHVRQQADADRAQAINLVKANDGDTVLGNPDGDITIYEFSDYNCGYCKRAFNDVMAALEEDGNIRLVIKEFPILSESSTIAAQLSMAAAELGQFEEFHTALMNWSGPLNDDAFTQITDELGMDLTALGQIIAKGEIDATIAETQELARSINITGTPGFIIGNEIVPGYIPKDQILELVRKARES